MRFMYRLRGLLAFAILVTSLAVITTDFAEARRGGSFGSRGMRSYSPPAATRTAPSSPNGLQRSMTPRQQAQPNAAGQAGAAQRNRGGLFGGLAGGLLGGLMLGGLIGMLMGNGIGGLAGMLGLLLQIGIGALVIMFVLRMFRGSRGQQARPAYAGVSSGSPYPQDVPPQTGRTPFETDARSSSSGAGGGGMTQAGITTGLGGATTQSGPEGGSDEIGLTADDFDTFEQLLAEVQAAFTREDFAALRARCTPEIVSFLSEELSENAVNGKRNDVTDVRLLQGDLAEAWRESDQEYASVAMRYESVDVMRDRQSGEIVSGDSHPTETTEIWTFVRPARGSWKLSAIQET